MDAKNTIDQQFKPSIMFRVSSIMCNFHDWCGEEITLLQRMCIYYYVRLFNRIYNCHGEQTIPHTAHT